MPLSLHVLSRASGAKRKLRAIQWASTPNSERLQLSRCMPRTNTPKKRHQIPPNRGHQAVDGCRNSSRTSLRSGSRIGVRPRLPAWYSRWRLHSACCFLLLLLAGRLHIYVRGLPNPCGGGQGQQKHGSRPEHVLQCISCSPPRCPPFLNHIEGPW